MARTTEAAATYFANLKKDFATEQYLNASKAQRGLPFKKVVTQFPIFQQALQINEESGTLTANERDSLIDYCIKIVNND